MRWRVIPYLLPITMPLLSLPGKRTVAVGVVELIGVVFADVSADVPVSLLDWDAASDIAGRETVS